MPGPADPPASSNPNKLERVERSRMLIEQMSHGRGGAGNIGADPNGYQEDVTDVKVPTLKTPVYTTGRGGTGNMAINDPAHPEYSRAAQDVDELPQRTSMSEFHGGRGGAGNVVHAANAEAELAREEAEKRRIAEEHAAAAAAERKDNKKTDYRGWADRGKDLLRAKFGKKSKG